MSIEKVVIIIPTYNEALVIEETLDRVFQATALINDFDVHVLIFDSCSPDSTQAIVRRLQKTNTQLHLITEQEKSGLGNAYLQAMRYALTVMSADIVFEFDADLSHQPKYLAPMLEKMHNHDVVVGSRYVSGGSIPAEWGWHRKLLSVLGNYTARFILSSKYKDFTSGFRATRRMMLEKVLPEKFLSNHYAYKIQLMWMFHQAKARIFEYPIDFIDRQKGISKLPANSIADSLHVLFYLRFNRLKSYYKMCLVGLTGVFIQCLVYNIARQSFTPLKAAQIAVVAAIINNFILNNRFTFKNNRAASFFQKLWALGLFVGYSMLMVGFQSYWLDLGIKFVGAGYLKENITMISGIIVGSFLNYITYSNLIWRRKKLSLS